jgi:hypothetical protein
MLPYTTYHIPETDDNKTGQGAKWLWMVFRKPLSEPEKDLLLKISAALKADFETEVLCILQGIDEASSISSVTGPKPGLIISFAVPPSELGLWIDLNQPGICTLESFSFILTIAPDALAGNAGAKKDLWKCMQSYLETR